MRDTGPDPDVPVTTTAAHHAPPGSLTLNTQPSSSWSSFSNAGPSTISSPNRIASTPHSSTAQTPGYPPTPGYTRPPMHPSRMNSAESGYYGSGLSHNSSLSSYSSSSGPPSGYPSAGLPHSYPHSGSLPQHYDTSGLQGQPLPRGQPPPQGGSLPRYYDPHYPNRRPGQ